MWIREKTWIKWEKKDLENRKEYIDTNILTGKYLLIGTWLWQNKNWLSTFDSEYLDWKKKKLEKGKLDQNWRCDFLFYVKNINQFSYCYY